MDTTRRGVLQGASAAALAASLFPASIGKALALPGRSLTGTLRDVEHVVILMQENRSFDHYYGALRGVRGFDDPRPTLRPDGRPIWQQSDEPGGLTAHVPFHLDTLGTAASWVDSLDHSWKGSHDRWKHYDVWIPEKSPMSMGHLTRADIPFFYALADAFTICDGYHCAIHGPTNPNRLYLFSGGNGISSGQTGLYSVSNVDDGNETADPANDKADFKGYAWTTYAERLEQAGVSWKVYQEYDNFGDNTVAYFQQYRGLPPDHPLRVKARSWATGSTAANAKQSRGEHMVAAFAADVAADRLPAVSWMVAPTALSEHPKAPPAFGEQLVARLVEALVSNPAVWAKTVFILNYDENDGFFDHAPPPVPAISPDQGASTVSVEGEIYQGQPVGLGPRVPLIAISPWSRGGWVNSQIFDHTSVLRFLEARFGVAEPNITPWRRAMTGDLTSVFDFTDPELGRLKAMPDTSGNISRTMAALKLPVPKVPQALPPAAAVRAMPRQEKGGRPARALPYALDVVARRDGRTLELDYRNTGAVGAVLTTRTLASHATTLGNGPWSHSLEAGRSLTHRWFMGDGGYLLMVHGPNGFLREIEGQADALPGVEVTASADPKGPALLLRLENRGTVPQTLTVHARAYDHAPARVITVAAGRQAEVAWPLAGSGGWYDLEVGGTDPATFRRRFAGHVETGRASVSDPALGRAV